MLTRRTYRFENVVIDLLWISHNANSLRKALPNSVKGRVKFIILKNDVAHYEAVYESVYRFRVVVVDEGGEK